MSVVGPHMLKHTQVYSALVDRYMERHKVRPGIIFAGASKLSGKQISLVNNLEGQSVHHLCDEKHIDRQ